jgi:hypothetical protein
MKRIFVSGLCASLIITGFAGTPAIAAAKEIPASAQITTDLDKLEVRIAYNEEFVTKKLTES